MIGQGSFRDADHVPRALFKAAQLAGAIADGPAHLPGKLRNNFIPHGQHGIDSGGAESRAVLQGNALPFFLRCVGRGKRSRNFFFGSHRAAGIELAVYRRETLDCFNHDNP